MQRNMADISVEKMSMSVSSNANVDLLYFAISARTFLTTSGGNDSVRWMANRFRSRAVLAVSAFLFSFEALVWGYLTMRGVVKCGKSACFSKSACLLRGLPTFFSGIPAAMRGKPT